jgi:hypothetical protein
MTQPQDSLKLTITERIFDLLASSAVTQGTLSIVVILGTLYIQITQGVVPSWLIELSLFIVGFFFGGKAGVVQGKTELYKSQAQGVRRSG